MKKVLGALGIIVGVYLIVRAIVEFITVDYAHPSSYALDWGGPSLFGVLAIHSGPGIVALGIFVWLLLRPARSERGR